MNNIIPQNIDKQKLEYLLNKVVEQTIKRQEAIELRLMLEDIDHSAMLRIGLGIFIRQVKDDEDTWQMVMERIYR